METLTLYRGDFESIEQFDFRKTKKTCLVGPGVYLSDSVRVAGTYRTKGALADSNNSPVLWAGVAENRPDAVDKAVSEFFERYYRQPLRDQSEKLRKLSWEVLYAKYRSEAKARLAELVREGRVKVNYLSTTPGRPRQLEVRLDVPRPKVGYVTEFAFPREEFTKKVVDVEGLIKDVRFWEILFDRKVNFGTPYAVRSDYVASNVQVRPDFKHNDAYNEVRKAVQPFGYLGFEYSGGRHVGGYGYHRAFCIWDDAFVNRHKVRQFV